jgi:hypothetical protein
LQVKEKISCITKYFSICMNGVKNEASKNLIQEVLGGHAEFV